MGPPMFILFKHDPIIWTSMNPNYELHEPELTSSTIASLQILVPLLSNGRNHRDWPRVVSHDVKHHVHSLKNKVLVVSGQVKGQTRLPLPAGVEGVEQASLELDVR